MPDGAEVSYPEVAVMVVALAFTIGLFAFAAWQALAGVTTAQPAANVTGVESEGANLTYYDVSLRNEGDVGLVSATVAVDCRTPARTVAFENVPARSHRDATVGCPAGSETPTARVITWIAE